MMKVLLLGYKDSDVYKYLNERYDTHQMLDILTVEIASQFDYIISYRYRHIIKQDVIDNVRNPIINLHMSFLPWNKGADPNFWSWHDNTLKGISIHQIDSGIDTGDILIQKEIYLNDTHTLRSSYNKLDSELENLFIDNFDKIVNKEIDPICQTKTGSIHYKKDLTSKQDILRNGWDTPVVEIKAKQI